MLENVIRFEECPVLRQPRHLGLCLTTWGGKPCASITRCLASRNWRSEPANPRTGVCEQVLAQI